MSPEARKAFLTVTALCVVVALGWASFFESLPPADFSIQNGTDVKTLDPARATGNVEGRVIDALFEGLMRTMPAGPPDPETGLQPMTAQPGMAESYEVSDDGLRYTFHIREGARWSNGDPVTSHDFVWSWQRTLHPETASEYTKHLRHIPHAKAYNEMRVEVGDRVEVELWDREGEDPMSRVGNVQPFPRGTMLYGTLQEIIKPAEPEIPPGASQEDKDSIRSKWKETWIYRVQLATEGDDGTVDWDATGHVEQFTQQITTDTDVQRCHWVLPAFGKLGGLTAPDDRTLIVTLLYPVPYFLDIASFYALYPTHRGCVETHGSPMWTKAENIVSNGPYRLQFRRIRDRLRVTKNHDHWDADTAALETVDFMSVEGQTTALNMYETEQLHWATDPPSILIEDLLKRPDFVTAPQLSVYFYRLNVNRPPLDNVLVRRALAMAINRDEIVAEVTKAGEIPAFTIVPPGLARYRSAEGYHYDPAEARRLLREAGFPDGRGIPRMTILYNTHEQHRAIAEVIQQQLRNNLNIAVALQNMEWGSFLDKVTQIDYQIARAGWIADYPDPNTFLDMWLTGGSHNSTGWSNREFDQLIDQAGREGDAERRMGLLRDAEQIFLDEMPAIPIYFYVSKNMVKPEVEGFYPTAQDLHPLPLLRLRQPSDEQPSKAKPVQESARSGAATARSNGDG